jgi:tetratricopeptide (TPR) repeat protein
LAELKAWVAKEPTNLPLLLTYIDALANTDLMKEALTQAREGLTRFSRSYELRLKLGELYERSRDYDRAVAFYSRATKDRPDSAEPWVRIGQVFEIQKRYLDAAKNFETASRIEPTFPEVWLLAARAYNNAGNIKEAATMYTREIEERPAVLNTFIEASEFLLKNNAPQEVPNLFRKFTADFQDDPRVLTRLSQAYLAMSEWDKAQQTAATALARNPNLPEPNRVLGFVYEQQGQYEMSQRYFEKYLELLPQAADADEIRSKLSNPPFGG